MNFRPILEKEPITVSVPCRIDLGGTLDISTFFLPLGHLNPATFNIALDMRTTVSLSPWKDNRIKISSRGFDSAEFDAGSAPFRHPMGLMFAVVRYFGGHGVHVHIDSSSPPRSALGGSSAAAVAMIAAFSAAMEKPMSPSETALLAHVIESSVAGVPCGLQDQLAAAFGGVNLWHWKMGSHGTTFNREPLPFQKNSRKFNDRADNERNITKETFFNEIDRHLLVAYCGIPHVSSDINKRWVDRFLSGKDRDKWEHIIKLTHGFVDALKEKDYSTAADIMNRETRIRMKMTPDVLDDTGLLLFEAANDTGCGARFTGAGGGGCIWAIGEESAIEELKGRWKRISMEQSDAELLDTAADPSGILIENMK